MAGNRWGGRGRPARHLPPRPDSAPKPGGPRPLSSRGHALGGGTPPISSSGPGTASPPRSPGVGGRHPRRPRPPPCLLDPGLLPLSLEAQGLLAVRQRLSSGPGLAQWASAWRSGRPGSGAGLPQAVEGEQARPQTCIGGSSWRSGRGWTSGWGGEQPRVQTPGETPEAELGWGRVTGGDQKGGRRTLEVGGRALEGGKWGTQTSSGGLRAVGQEPGRPQRRRPSFWRWKMLCARRLGTAPPGSPALGYPRSRKTNRPGQAGLDVRGKPHTCTHINTLPCAQPPACTPYPSRC